MAMMYEVPRGFEMRMGILKAFNRLLAEKPFDTISVSEICKEAGIARQTFYVYFSDKYNASNWYAKVMADESLAQIGRTLTWFEGYVAMHQFVTREYNFFERVSHCRDDANSLMRFIVRYSDEVWHQTLVEHLGVAITPSLDFQIRLWSKASAEAVFDWRRGGSPQLVPEDLSRNLNDCVPRELRSIMDNAVLRQRS